MGKDHHQVRHRFRRYICPVKCRLGVREHGHDGPWKEYFAGDTSIDIQSPGIWLLFKAGHLSLLFEFTVHETSQTNEILSICQTEQFFTSRVPWSNRFYTYCNLVLWSSNLSLLWYLSGLSLYWWYENRLSLNASTAQTLSVVSSKVLHSIIKEWLSVYTVQLRWFFKIPPVPVGSGLGWKGLSTVVSPGPVDPLRSRGKNRLIKLLSNR